MVDYELDALTTAGRYWVSGTATTPTGTEQYRMFVKHVRAWQHSPFFAFVPEEAKPMAAASLPWRIEPLAYRSDLGARLPDGLSMPRALGVFDLEPDAAAIWLPDVTRDRRPWTLDRYARAAYLLGRMSGSARVGELSDIGEFTWSVHDYVAGRLTFDVVPEVLRDDAWFEPGVAAAFDDDLRDRMRRGAELVADQATELHGLPHAPAHGDASPNNLLPGAGDDDFTLIDYGFFMMNPIGFDLGQLVAGEAQLGRRCVTDLDTLDTACLAAYHRGLTDEGMVVDPVALRRAHALHLWLFVGISSLPGRDQMPPEQLTQRAALAQLSLDLLDATA